MNEDKSTLNETSVDMDAPSIQDITMTHEEVKIKHSITQPLPSDIDGKLQRAEQHKGISSSSLP